MIVRAKEEHPGFSERELCRLFEVSRSWYYECLNPEEKAAEDVELSIADVPDGDLASLLQDLAEHNLESMLEAYGAADAVPDRPTVVPGGDRRSSRHRKTARPAHSAAPVSQDTTAV